MSAFPLNLHENVASTPQGSSTCKTKKMSKFLVWKWKWKNSSLVLSNAWGCSVESAGFARRAGCRSHRLCPPAHSSCPSLSLEFTPDLEAAGTWVHNNLGTSGKGSFSAWRPLWKGDLTVKLWHPAGAEAAGGGKNRLPPLGERPGDSGLSWLVTHA